MNVEELAAEDALLVRDVLAAVNNHPVDRVLTVLAMAFVTVARQRRDASFDAMLDEFGELARDFKAHCATH